MKIASNFGMMKYMMNAVTVCIDQEHGAQVGEPRRGRAPGRRPARAASAAASRSERARVPVAYAGPDQHLGLAGEGARHPAQRLGERHALVQERGEELHPPAVRPAVLVGERQRRVGQRQRPLGRDRQRPEQRLLLRRPTAARGRRPAPTAAATSTGRATRARNHEPRDDRQPEDDRADADHEHHVLEPQAAPRGRDRPASARRASSSPGMSPRSEFTALPPVDLRSGYVDHGSSHDSASTREPADERDQRQEQARRRPPRPPTGSR